MTSKDASTGEVFSAREIARAAGVSSHDAEALLASGAIDSAEGGLVDAPGALRAVLLLRGVDPGPAPERQLFRPLRQTKRNPGGPLTAAGLVHATAFGIFALLATLPLTGRASVEPRASEQPRLVFLVKPGPGGGGGGGGLRQPAPPKRAALKDSSTLKSPVPVERAVRRRVPDPPPPKPLPPPPEVTPTPQPAEPPPPVAKPDPVPPVVAPVVSASSDTRDERGSLNPAAPPTNSQGPGNGGGAGSGSGTGNGEGDGPGIGPGSGGGTGGGPYRPGSGIEAPELVREVKPDYTEDARRRGLAGDVVLEIVVRSDGRVGPVRVLQGLGGGLDQRAVDAVRQWRFSPARRLGTPVDVVVEVAVEFRLR
jgi:periplasmic protein TonB